MLVPSVDAEYVRPLSCPDTFFVMDTTRFSLLLNIVPLPVVSTKKRVAAVAVPAPEQP